MSRIASYLGIPGLAMEGIEDFEAATDLLLSSATVWKCTSQTGRPIS
jgi:hypothetical protein